MMQTDAAEGIALKALAWIAADEDLLGVFLGASGAQVSDLRARITEPDFLASVLEFLTMDDQWVMSFCKSEGLAFEAPMQARAVLPGGQIPSWT